jgi:hypothetical protein
MERRLFLATGLLLAANWATPSPSASPPATPTPAAASPTRIRGSIVGLAGNVLTVNSRDGQKLEITLKDPVTVATVTKEKLSDIQENSFIGTATRTEKDGKLIALEVLVFPEAMRGAGEGFYPWDLRPGSMMTNGTVKGTVKSAKGQELTVSYKDKASGTDKTNTVYVPPSAPIVTFAAATAADLKVGAKVFLAAMPGPDGKLTAARVAPMGSCLRCDLPVLGRIRRCGPGIITALPGGVGCRGGAAWRCNRTRKLCISISLPNKCI